MSIEPIRVLTERESTSDIVEIDYDAKLYDRVEAAVRAASWHGEGAWVDGFSMDFVSCVLRVLHEHYDLFPKREP